MTQRPTDVDVSRARKDPDAWWTVLAIDPVAVRVLPWLAARPVVTPDRLSLASLVVALAAGACFLDERFVLGPVLFELHFLLDCLDGKLARVRGTSSPRGGFLDVACDLLGTTWCFGALGVAVFEGTSTAYLALVAAVAHVAYTWSTATRSGAGAIDRQRERTGLAGALRRRRMVSAPGGVETETGVLFLLPLLGREDVLRVALVAAAVFLALLGARNTRATYRALPAG